MVVKLRFIVTYLFLATVLIVLTISGVFQFNAPVMVLSLVSILSSGIIAILVYRALKRKMSAQEFLNSSLFVVFAALLLIGGVLVYTW